MKGYLLNSVFNKHVGEVKECLFREIFRSKAAFYTQTVFSALPCAAFFDFFFYEADAFFRF